MTELPDYNEIPLPEYAAGASDGKGGFGMFCGPSTSLADVLACSGIAGRASFIFRFNPNGEEQSLYRWHNGRGEWIALPLQTGE